MVIADKISDVSHREAHVVLLDLELDKGDLLSLAEQDKSKADLTLLLVPGHNRSRVVASVNEKSRPRRKKMKHVSSIMEGGPSKSGEVEVGQRDLVTFEQVTSGGDLSLSPLSKYPLQAQIFLESLQRNRSPTFRDVFKPSYFSSPRPLKKPKFTIGA